MWAGIPTLRSAKGSVYEGGVRVSLIVGGAGVTRRGREDETFVTTDLYATILNLTGVSVSQVNNNYSLKPLLGNEAGTSGRTHSFTEISNGVNNRSYAIKDRRSKLISNDRAFPAARGGGGARRRTLRKAR